MILSLCHNYWSLVSYHMCSRCDCISQLRNLHLWKTDFLLKQKKASWDLEQLDQKSYQGALNRDTVSLGINRSGKCHAVTEELFWGVQRQGSCPLLSPALCSHLPLLHGLRGSSAYASRDKCWTFYPMPACFSALLFQRSVSSVFLFTFLFACTPLQTLTNTAPAGCRSSSSTAPTGGCPRRCSSAGSPGSRHLPGSPAPSLVLGSLVPDDPTVLPGLAALGSCSPLLSPLPQGPWATLIAWLVRVRQCCWAVEQQQHDWTPNSHRCSPQLRRAAQISVAGGDFLSFL